MNKNNKISSWRGLKIDKERLFEFSKMSIESRLQWLEEANEFLNTITNKEIKHKWQIFKES